MKETTESIIALLSMFAMFGLGMWANTDNITYDLEEKELSYQKVEYKGTIHRAGYEFKFVEEIEKPEKFENTTIKIKGRAIIGTNRKIIKIKTGAPAQDIHETCNHEVLHHYFPNYRHPNFLNPANRRSDDPIYKLEDQVDLPVCDDVTAAALMRQR